MLRLHTWKQQGLPCWEVRQQESFGPRPRPAERPSEDPGSPSQPRKRRVQYQPGRLIRCLPHTPPVHLRRGSICFHGYLPHSVQPKLVVLRAAGRGPLSPKLGAQPKPDGTRTRSAASNCDAPHSPHPHTVCNISHPLHTPHIHTKHATHADTLHTC